jgi:hypothetical protein
VLQICPICLYTFWCDLRIAVLCVSLSLTYKACQANFRWETPNDFLKSALDFGPAGWQPHLVTWICRPQTFFFVPRATERRLEWHRDALTSYSGGDVDDFGSAGGVSPENWDESASGGWAV